MALPKLNTPTYNMTIPSTGHVVDFRPYLVKEEKVLMIAMESDDGLQMNKAIQNVIAACTFDKVDTNKLTLFDVEYMFATLRSKSVGETSIVTLPCEKCEKRNEVTINLEELKVSEKIDNKIPLTSDTGLIMKYPSMADYLDLVNSDLSDIDKIFGLVAISIEEIYSGDEVYDTASQTRKEVLEFVESLSAEQFKNVKKYIDAMPQTYVDANFKCESCGNDNSMKLKGLKNFFN